LSANPFFHDGIQGCEFLPNPFKLLDLLDVRAFEGPGLSAVVEGGVAVLEELFEPGVELVGYRSYSSQRSETATLSKRCL